MRRSIIRYLCAFLSLFVSFTSPLFAEEVEYTPTQNALGAMTTYAAYNGAIAMGDYEDALVYAESYLALAEKLWGQSHEYYGNGLYIVATCSAELGRHEEAIPLYREALAHVVARLGKLDPHYETVLDDLVFSLKVLGEYEVALPLYREALRFTESTSGVTSPVYVVDVGNLALCLSALGRYSEALPLFHEALTKTELISGKADSNYRSSLNNLAYCLYCLGRYSEAVPLFREVLLLTESSIGKSHVDYGAVLSNLGTCLDSIGRSEEALPLLREALINAESSVGKLHSDYGTRLNNMAACLGSLGRYDEALPLHRDALSIMESNFGRTHPEYGQRLNNLATCLDSLSRYDEALILYQEALMITESALGKSHPGYGLRLSNLAHCLRELDRFDEALLLSREALQLVVRLLERDSVFRSEQEQLQAASRVRGSLDVYLSTDGLEANAGFAEILSWKGAVLARQRSVRLAAEDPEVAPLFEALQQNASELAAWSGSYPQDASQVDVWRERLDALTQKQEALELELNAASAVYREGTTRITLDAFQAILPEGSVFVDYFVYESGGKKKVLAHVVDAETVSRYEMGVIAASSSGSAIAAWRADLLSRNDDRASGEVLRRLIWDPLADALANRETILLCPDGVLGTVPFAALPDVDGKRLLENHRLALVPVPQLLPALLSEARGSGKPGLMTIGDVDYDHRGEGAAPTEVDSVPETSRCLLTSTIRGGTRFGSLAETAVEIESIERLYREVFETSEVSIVRYQGTDASEAVFREEAGQRGHLHIATHGFFAPPEVESALAPAAGNSRNGLSRFSDEGREALSGYDPNLLSGLVFAGANLPVESGDTDDGILTSREIAFLSLEEVDLVTLSACETGLGDVAGGEGLLGIQRAFQISGAGSTIASLWTVDDLATRELMERFYTNYWQGGMSKLDALREAQLAQMNAAHATGSNRGIEFEDEADALTSQSHPYYWAAFQLSGDWR